MDNHFFSKDTDSFIKLRQNNTQSIAEISTMKLSNG